MKPPNAIKNNALRVEETLNSWKEEVGAARELLEFVILTLEGGELSAQVIRAIHDAEQRLHKREDSTPEQRVAFDRAYRELALFAAPVTIETLRATSDAHGRKAWVITWGKPLSEAVDHDHGAGLSCK